ncbi:peptidase domain-containing ABC transporter [Ferrimonas marina]|uniref:Colicin V processing peptidase. Cysteine peptidase. MEROPS family C39 n=1 Tax=Ferrimonas marina TaxID=299255 RepID=A0A1M5ZA66_9GAMM|nr:peptidase domain-containing ABC transporter [Ferrimonas marina]SHI21124.1 colicin V processing peptidase. Cysteine peptidase. MEROPS family C39 [Ferrimonas marina]
MTMQTDMTPCPTQLLTFSGTRQVPLILQAEMAECGLASLAMVASYHGHKLDLAALRQRFPTLLKGMNLHQMIQLADGLGLNCRALKCPLPEIGKLQLPCVLHWDMNHFVVLTGVRRDRVYINDPACGKRILKLPEFAQHFTGVALELRPGEGFVKQDKRQPLQLRQLWGQLTGLLPALGSLLILSLLLQLAALAAPYYMQWVVDEVLLSQDRALLSVLAIGFALLVLFKAATGALRGWLVLRLSSLFNLQLGANLLRHLLRLPMTYFETRHVGDLVSRFGALNQVRERLTTGIVEAMVDGLMSLAVLVMMALYSIKLTLVVLAFIGLYTLLRLVLIRQLQRATEESIQASAKEQTHFIESLRAIQTIKLQTREAQRHGIWLNRYAEVINADIRLGKLRIGFDTLNQTLFGLENVLVVFLAAGAVMAGQLTVGMVLAFMAYKGQLSDHIAKLIEQMIQFRMLRLYLDRIADIALHPQEAHREGCVPLDQVKGELRLEGVHFRYGPDQPEILQGVDLTIRAGESVAITGPSGCGKTTLMKIMLGLLTPTQGRITLDGKEITQIGLLAYRQQIGAIMQEDQLLSGTVADNITGFDPNPDRRRLERCASQAAISDEIQQLPMGFLSLVGDMGSQFSGGQKQRLLLARALYQQPAVLFLDEATSHLDHDNEAKISEQIAALNITRVMVAHRQETLSTAQRCVTLSQGRLLETEGSPVTKNSEPDSESPAGPIHPQDTVQVVGAGQ